MRSLLLKLAIGVMGCGSLYLIQTPDARAESWGCQVILCLSNPGGPMQYSECRPPIQKLWSWLARGHAFPTCNGVGFKSSRPRYEPYYCQSGYRLFAGQSAGGRAATCISTSLQAVDGAFCRNERSVASIEKTVISPRMQRNNSRNQCLAYVTTRPFLREKPSYIDVTIGHLGKHRVWY